MLEINYYKTSSQGLLLRRQLLQIDAGWTLSNAEVNDIAPKSLRGYDGGWHFSDTIYATRAAAERNLRQNRWALEGTPLLAEGSRNRPRSARKGNGRARLDVELTELQRAAITEEATRTGESLAVVVGKWADSLAKKHARKNRTGKAK